MTDDQQAKIEAIIKACLRHHERQQTVIIGLFLAQKSVLAIAEELEITPREVYGLKTEALANLRKCETLLKQLELLIK